MNNLLKVGVLSSMLTLPATSCQRLPLKELPAEQVSSVVINRVDSFISESNNLLKKNNYQTFMNDTIKITKDFFNNPAKFFKKLDKEAASNVPRTVVRTYTVMVPSVVHKWRVVEPQTRHEYEKNFIEPRTIMCSNKIFTRDSVDIYIPVKYVGIPNPKLQVK